MRPTRAQLVLRFSVGFVAAAGLGFAHQVPGLVVGALLVILGAAGGPKRESLGFPDPQQISRLINQWVPRPGDVQLETGRLTVDGVDVGYLTSPITFEYEVALEDEPGRLRL